MVDVAQLVELRIVTPAVEGSNPFVHPTFLEGFISAFVASMGSSRVAGKVTICCARVAELVDALDLGSSGATRESSSLSSRTILSFSAPFLLPFIAPTMPVTGLLRCDQSPETTEFW